MLDEDRDELMSDDSLDDEVDSDDDEFVPSSASTDRSERDTMTSAAKSDSDSARVVAEGQARGRERDRGGVARRRGGRRARGQRVRGGGGRGRGRQRGGVFADVNIGPANNTQPVIPDFSGEVGLFLVAVSSDIILV
jgi:hypothetical protein